MPACQCFKDKEYYITLQTSVQRARASQSVHKLRTESASNSPSSESGRL